MQIGHVTSSISRIGAGVSKFIRDLSEVQADNGDAIHIFTLFDQFTNSDQPSNNSITVSACPITVLPRFGYSYSLQKTFANHAGILDILHLHGLWMYPNWAAGSVAKATGIPFVMSPHGMLEPWSLGRGNLKKKATGLLFEYDNLASARCIHACSEQEFLNIRRFGYKGPIAVVPLGLTRDEFMHTSRSEANSRINRPQPFENKRVLLFLSRLHVVKGLDLLLAAWEAVRRSFPEWHLVIAGDGEAAYVAHLKKTALESGLNDSVTFTGAVHGKGKWDLLKNADLFVLPTLSENFGLVVAEALACGIPVITTKGAPWGDLEMEECGWWINPGVTALSKALTDTLSLPANQLAEMGGRGRRLIERKYLVDITARTLHSVYTWMLNGGTSPDCVRFD